MIFTVFFGTCITIFSFFMIKSTEAFLRFQDIFRITGHREYSGFSIVCMMLSGITGVLFGTYTVFQAIIV